MATRSAAGRHCVPVEEETAPATLHGGVDEQPVFVDESGGDEGVPDPELPVETHRTG